jgi:ribosomal protein S18 acetylase RimI-like enzyme
MAGSAAPKGRRRKAEITDLVIRRATLDDLKAIGEVYGKCFPRSGLALLGKRSSLCYFSAMAENESYRIFVAEEADGIVGFAILTDPGGKRMSKRFLLACAGVWREVAIFCLRQPLVALGHVLRALCRVFQRDRGRAVKGDVNLRFAEMRAAWIEPLGVKPSHQGRGIASRLVTHLCEVAAEMEFDCVKLGVDNSNQRAIGVYERTGFIRTAEGATKSTYARECDAGESKREVK